MRSPSAPFDIKAVRYIEDPIHGTIALSQSECQVVDHPFMQRLRNIRQLGNASFVFPGAMHTRFSHVLGVMHQAGELCKALFSNADWTSKKRSNKKSPPASQVDAALKRLFSRVRLGGLLHDLGHGPYSHHFELFLKAEKLTVSDLQKTDLRIPISWIAAAARDRYLSESLHHEHFSYGLIHLLDLNGGERRAILSLLDSRFTCGPDMEADLRTVAAKAGVESAWPSLLACLRSLLSSDIDADRMDYLRRDSHFCGIRVALDTEHLMRSLSLSLSEKGFVICVDRNAIFSIEQLLLARKQMFSQVYQNRVNQLLDELLSHAMEHIRARGLMRAPLSAREFLGMDDLWLTSKLRDILAAAAANRTLSSPGETATAMYLTRTLPVTLSVQDVKFEDLSKVTRRLSRNHQKGSLLCLPQKELMAREKRAQRRKGGSSESGRPKSSAQTVLFTATEKGGSLQPITEVSELIQSTAWSSPSFRVIVTKGLEESAAERNLHAKLHWLPLGEPVPGSTDLKAPGPPRVKRA